VNGYLTSTDWNTFNSKQPAGSYLVSGGALGTPSSGTVTNLTGTASININGTVGATTANTGAFTTLSATGVVDFRNASTGAGELQVGGTTLSSSLGGRVSYDQNGATILSIYNNYSNSTASKIQIGFGTTLGSLVGVSITKDLAVTIPGTLAAGATTVTGTLSATTGAAVGGATPGAGGLAFPATAVAVADANTLDDYEEGSWTPAIAGGTTAGSYTYQASRTGGRYTKVGNMVTVWGVCRIATIVSAGTGTLCITGLPFGAGSNLASSWPNSDALVVNMYGAGVNASAATYPPPITGAPTGVNSTTFETSSYGKNYIVSTVIGSLSAVDWIYEIYGSYTV
jgi:hypothetical protein